MSEAPEPVSPKALWLGVLVLGAIGLAIVWLTTPAHTLLGEEPGAVPGALHGTVAGLFMVTATIGAFQAYRLFIGRAVGIAELQVGSVVNAVLALFTLLLGNWIYIAYRAPGGPRSFFLEQRPEVHKICFEFKEFVGLFPFPLAVAAAYLFARHGKDLYRIRGLSTVAALLLLLTFFYFMVAFGLGATITKLRPA